jgi:uncharacterized lipoprotein YbaY
MRIEGVLRFPDDVPVPCVARVFVRLEDATVADAPSLLVAERVLEQVEARPRATAAFALDVAGLWPGRRYIVRAHADCDGDGELSRGDYVSTQSHPISIGRSRIKVRIPLKRIE